MKRNLICGFLLGTLLTVLIHLPILTLASCSPGLGAIAMDTGINCGLPLVANQAEGLLGQVVRILSGEAPDWAAQLDQLASGGREAVACAVARATGAPHTSAGGTLIPASAGVLDAASRERGTRWLAQRGLVTR